MNKFLKVPISDEDLTIEVVKNYNQTYNTRFGIVEFDDYDGVIFAIIDIETASLYHVFNLGYTYGAIVQANRDKRIKPSDDETGY